MSNKNEISIAVNTMNDLLEKIIEAGDVDSSALEAVSRIEPAIPNNVDALALLIERAKAERAFFKATADRYSKIARVLAKIEENIRDSVKLQLVERGLSDAEGLSNRFKLSEIDPRLEITDESKIPEEYKIQVVQIKINDMKLREDLAAGKHVAGAMLVSNYRLAVYANRKLKAASNE